MHFLCYLPMENGYWLSLFMVSSSFFFLSSSSFYFSRSYLSCNEPAPMLHCIQRHRVDGSNGMMGAEKGRGFIVL